VVGAGTRLSNALRARPVEADAVIVHGTFIPPGKKKHPLNLALTDQQSGGGSVRCVTTIEGWVPDRIAVSDATFRDQAGNESPSTVATDLDPNLPERLTQDEAFSSPCHIRIMRHPSMLLWKDGLKQAPHKNVLLGRVSDLLRHLRNSLNAHLPKGETEAFEHRIQATNDELRALAFYV
jgi:hypothetical protein